MSELSYVVDRVLHNSVNVMIRQRDELGIEGYPLSPPRREDLSERFQGFPTIESGMDELRQDSSWIEVSNPRVFRCGPRYWTMEFS